MKYNEGGLIDFLFGDWLYVRMVKRGFKKDELYARCLYAFHSMDDYTFGIENDFTQKTCDILRGPTVDRNKSIPNSINTVQSVARETHLLFVGLTSVCVSELFGKNNEESKKIIKNITKLYQEKLCGYEMQDIEFNEYVDSGSLIKISELFGKRIASVFSITDTLTIDELGDNVIKFYEVFSKRIKPAFTAKKDDIVSEMTDGFSPWAGLITVLVIITIVAVVHFPEKQNIVTGPNVYVEACREGSEGCYSLKAEYVSTESCAPVEYDTRGASGGRCFTNSYIKKIYFVNGGYRAFRRSDCSEISSSEWMCTDNDGDDWSIEFVGRINNE